jgi:hypothetical protein
MASRGEKRRRFQAYDAQRKLDLAALTRRQVRAEVEAGLVEVADTLDEIAWIIESIGRLGCQVSCQVLGDKLSRSKPVDT